MNRLAAVSLFTAVVAAGACATTEAPTSPDAATRAVIGQGAGLAKVPSECPKPAPRPSRPVQLQSLPLDPLPVSTVGVVQVNVLFTNATCEALEMVWVRPTGVQVSYGWLQPGGNNVQLTYVGHVWLIKRTDGTPYAVFRIEDYASGTQEVFLGCAKGKNAVCN
jgi:von Hippel-Lindau disease tumor suppressor protein